jgi:ubiquinone/menaquinone biosynthesis C-methylase UbiE
MTEVLEYVEDVFNEEIVEYKKNFRLNRLLHAEPTQVLTKAELYNGIRILDLGCGTGQLLFTISDLLDDYELRGLDWNQNRIETAQANIENGQNIDFVTGDVSRLPFESTHFDIVTCTNTFVYVEHKGKMLQEVYRVLKPSGRFFLLESIRSTDYKNKLDKIMRQSPFIKYSRRFLKRTALLSKSYLISCQK